MRSRKAFARDTGSLFVLNFALRKITEQHKFDIIRQCISDEEEQKSAQSTISVLDILLPYGLLSETECGILSLSMCTWERMHLVEHFLSLYPEFDPIANKHQTFMQ